MAIPGFYVAANALIAPYLKVGHTDDLRRRLQDSAYVTCFPPDSWRYALTVELADKADARRLEAAVLFCAGARRLAPRELVAASADELAALAVAAAAALKLVVKGAAPALRRDPAYARREPRRTAAAVAEAEADAGAADEAAALPALRQLCLPANADAITGANAGANAGMNAGANAGANAFAPTDTLACDTVALAGEPDDLVADLVDDQVADFGETDVQYALAQSQVAQSQLQPREPLRLRDYQAAAAAAVAAELARAGGPGRAILQMACRCGKTPVAFAAAQALCAFANAFAERAPTVLFLVPGLYLLRQTAQKLAAYKEAPPTDFLLVGSDGRAVETAAGPLAMTTDEAAVRAFCVRAGAGAATSAGGAGGVCADAAVSPRWVISTYQSSHLLVSALPQFDLIVFDEAHRACGGRAPRPFNAVLRALASQAPAPALALAQESALAPAPASASAPAQESAPRCLFMTATPAYEPLAPDVFTMRDRATFGGVAARYYLREGIAAGHVNDFRLELVPCFAHKAIAGKTPLSPEGAAVIAAMRTVDKLLVFCRDIAHAAALQAEVGAALAAGGAAKAAPPSTFECLAAHSRMPAGGAVAALARFAAPGVRAALFNCRMLQEGVEVPPLNAVLFAAPRHSPRDIIQSLCRPLNPAPGKPQSVVFLPVEVDPAEAADAPANLRRYASVLPFVDALLDEDPRLFEYLIGGNGIASNGIASNPQTQILTVLGGAGASAGTSASTAAGASPAAVLAACRRVIRHGVAGALAIASGARPSERLLRADAIPWDRAYAELRRVVLECRRYPKTTDEWVVSLAPASAEAGASETRASSGEARVNLHAIYSQLAARYRGARGAPGSAAGADAALAPAAAAKAPEPLEPYQRAALEALPGWLPFGAEGPYAWGYCMGVLERWLETKGADALALEINKGGYVGLEATDIERLSGALTCVNQQVFGKKVTVVPAASATATPAAAPKKAPRETTVRAADRVPPAHAADLDRICGRFNLRWRKVFRADGTVDPAHPTFIQEAYARFKRMYAESGADHPYIREHFPGYPLKHARQCALDLAGSAALPPRRPRAARGAPTPKAVWAPRGPAKK